MNCTIEWWKLTLKWQLIASWYLFWVNLCQPYQDNMNFETTITINKILACLEGKMFVCFQVLQNIINFQKLFLKRLIMISLNNTKYLSFIFISFRIYIVWKTLNHEIKWFEKYDISQCIMFITSFLIFASTF